MTAVLDTHGPARYGPFLVVLLFALGVPALAGDGGPVAGWWLAAAGVGAVMTACWVLGDRRADDTPTPLGLLAAYLTFPLVLLLEKADVGHAGALIPLLLLPVVWCTLHQRGRALAGAVVLSAATLFLPIELIGSPSYPATTWRRSLLWILVLGLLAPAMQTLLRSTRRTAVSVARSEQQYRTAFAGAVEDITVRRESEHALLDALEQQALAAAQLRELAQARTDLVSAVSHDVRTPLATIGAYVELLESGDAGVLTPDQRSMLDVIEENVQRAYAITDDLLALGRIEHTAATEDREPVTIAEVLTEAVDSVEPSAAMHGQRLSIESRLEGVHVAGHPGQLDRMILNLLTNALKFTPDGGSITVRGQLVLGEVVIEVSDTGIGIVEDEQDRIFERFYRSDTARLRRIGGTGLGLAIVKEIATLHGGSVTVRSTPGAGSTFTLRLPALAQAA